MPLLQSRKSKDISYSCSIEENHYLWAPALAVVNHVLWLNSIFLSRYHLSQLAAFIAISELTNENSDSLENATKQKV